MKQASPATAPGDATEWNATTVINDTIERLQLRPEVVRLAYWATGGDGRGARLAAFLAGDAALTEREYNTLAAALNDRLIEVGAPPTIPYTEDRR